MHLLYEQMEYFNMLWILAEYDKNTVAANDIKTKIGNQK